MNMLQWTVSGEARLNYEFCYWTPAMNFVVQPTISELQRYSWPMHRWECSEFRWFTEIDEGAHQKGIAAADERNARCKWSG